MLLYCLVSSYIFLFKDVIIYLFYSCFERYLYQYLSRIGDKGVMGGYRVGIFKLGLDLVFSYFRRVIYQNFFRI